MSAAGYQALLDDLKNLDAAPEMVAAFRQLIFDRLDAERSPTERRVAFVRELLVQREPTVIIRERLQARFGVSRRQAYRDIDLAKQVVPSRWHGARA